MKAGQARDNINESLTSGSARMVRQAVILPKDELVAAVVRCQDGDERAWPVVIGGVSRMVFKKASACYYTWAPMLPPSAMFDDVFSAGLEAVHKAVTGYDRATGYAFTTYADAWIRSYSQRACYAMIGATHIPEYMIRAGLETDDPLCARRMLAFDHRTHEDGEELHERVRDYRSDLESEMVDMEMVGGVMRVLRRVDRRLPRIIELFELGHSGREIASIIGVSPERVRQLRERAAAAVESSGVAQSYL